MDDCFDDYMQIKDLNTHGFEVIFTTSGVVGCGQQRLRYHRLVKVSIVRMLSVEFARTIGDIGILDNWSKIKPIILEAWSENRDELIELFRNIKDKWMDSDLVSWIGANRFYPGAFDALKFGPKVEVLKKLQKQPEHHGLILQFSIQKSSSWDFPSFSYIHFPPQLLIEFTETRDWGYNTQNEREEAANIPRIG
ncbi:hypothetical protein ACFE04_020885 [Oxalis oulophora]